MGWHKMQQKTDTTKRNVIPADTSHLYTVNRPLYIWCSIRHIPYISEASNYDDQPKSSPNHFFGRWTGGGTKLAFGAARLPVNASIDWWLAPWGNSISFAGGAFPDMILLTCALRPHSLLYISFLLFRSCSTNVCSLFNLLNSLSFNMSIKMANDYQFDSEVWIMRRLLPVLFLV